jgi:hypothetical protein
LEGGEVTDILMPYPLSFHHQRQSACSSSTTTMASSDDVAHHIIDCVITASVGTEAAPCVAQS